MTFNQECFDRHVRQVCTLLYCKHWKPEQVEKLMGNINTRYSNPKVMVFALGRAHDMQVSGMQIDDIIDKFKPECD